MQMSISHNWTRILSVLTNSAETLDKLRQFLGMLNFYRAHLPKAAQRQTELNKFLKGAI